MAAKDQKQGHLYGTKMRVLWERLHGPGQQEKLYLLGSLQDPEIDKNAIKERPWLNSPS